MWYLGGTLKTVILLQYCKEGKVELKDLMLNPIYGCCDLRVNRYIRTNQRVSIFSKRTYKSLVRTERLGKIGSSITIYSENYIPLHRDIVDLNGKLVVYENNKDYQFVDYFYEDQNKDIFLSPILVQNKKTGYYNFMSLETGKLVFPKYDFQYFYEQLGNNERKIHPLDIMPELKKYNGNVRGKKDNGKWCKLKGRRKL